ncbi:MAG: hypothetical protein ABIT61_12130 [Steroidobacteraceae bacterium]
MSELMQSIVSIGVTRSGNPATGASQVVAKPVANVSLEWRETLRNALDPELGPHIANVLVKAREIVVFTESAAWCTRLKLAMGQISQVVKARDAGIVKVVVKVMPAGSADR